MFLVALGDAGVLGAVGAAGNLGTLGNDEGVLGAMYMRCRCDHR